MIQDISFAVRVLLKDRGFTVGAILVLGLGLGVNTTVFTIINGMSWRGLPVPHADRIMEVASTERRQDTYTSYADFLDWKAVNRTFSDLAVYRSSSTNIGDEQRPADRVAGIYMSANALAILGVEPILGRAFSPDDDRVGAAAVAMLSHALWRNRYAAEPGIVGTAIRINGASTMVIGVMPEGFRFPVQADLWQPAAQHPTFNAVARDHRIFNVFGRLRDGISLAQARAEFTQIAAGISIAHADSNREIGARIVPFTEAYVSPPTSGEPVLMLSAGVLVLLIACANAANLLLARAFQRTREITLRAALGATRLRIVRQLLLESLVLAALGAIAGLLFARAATIAFVAETIDLNLPYWIHFGFDARVFGYLAVLACVTAMTFGLAPAWQLSNPCAHDILKEGARTTVGSARSRRWAGALLVSELALTLTLLAGAGVLLRSADALYTADATLDLDTISSGQLALPTAKFPTPDQRRAFVDRLHERLDAVSVISSATLASARPFVDSVTRRLVIEGDNLEAPRLVQVVAVGDHYFETLRLPILRGRGFVSSDAGRAPEEVIINERFAALHFRDADPIGKRIQLNEPAPDMAHGPWLTIVGVSPSVRQRPAGGAAAVAYVPLRTAPGPLMSIIARSETDHLSIAGMLRDAVRHVDPDVALYNLEPLRRLSEKSRWGARVLSALVTLFGLIAVVMSGVGLYSLTAYGVAQRTSEIGVRIALGASRSQVAWLFLRRTLVLVSIGLLIGLAGAVAIGQVLRGVVPHASGTDPMVLAVTVMLLVATAVGACIVPARRAMRQDPVAALRHE